MWTALFAAGVATIGTPTSWKVTQRGSGANMSVDIAAGFGFLPSSSFHYASYSDATVNKTVTTADPSNPRRDIAVAYLDLAAVTTAVNNAQGALKFAVVAGTPGASPSDPSDSAIQAAVGAGNPWRKLGRIRIGTPGSYSAPTSVIDSMIDDIRQPIAFKGNLWGGSGNTNGHIVPNVADDTLALLAAAQTLQNKTISHSQNFVIIRAGHVGPSYGGNDDRHDPKFERNAVGAVTAGLEIGYYWYCYFDEDPEVEAERFAMAVTGYYGSLWADFEAGSGTPNKDWAKRFVTKVEELTERRCHIYTGHAYLKSNDWLLELLISRDLWLADYSAADLSLPYAVEIHQYSDSGSLPGISTAVDLNYGYITIDEFKQLGDKIVINQPEPTTPATQPEQHQPLPPIEPVPVKPGYKTSEFYAALVLVTPVILKLFGVTLSPDETTQIVELVASTAIAIAGAGGYIVSRYKTKTEAIKATEKVNK